MAAKTMDDITTLLKAMKFKKRLFGGVDEDEVWRALWRMQTEYRSVVEATEQRCGALLNERDILISKQQKQLAEIQAQLAHFGRGGVNG